MSNNTYATLHDLAGDAWEAFLEVAEAAGISKEDVFALEKSAEFYIERSGHYTKRRKHSYLCALKTAQDRARYAAYVAKWPHYCRKCDGSGGRWLPGTYHYPPDFDPCGCLEDGYCPRCGVLTWEQEDFDGAPVTCPECGWQEDDPDEAPIPWIDGPCRCEEMELRATNL